MKSANEAEAKANSDGKLLLGGCYAAPVVPNELIEDRAPFASARL
jgi:hypothetical protein